MTAIYLKNRFFVVFGICISIFLMSFSFPELFMIAKYSLILLLACCILDYYLLYRHKDQLIVNREVGDRLSLSDTTHIFYSISNESSNPIHCEVIDELPFQLQKRDFFKRLLLKPDDRSTFNYELRPVMRGKYSFGSLHAYISSPYIGLLQRKISFSESHEVDVIPSVEQMKKYELQVFSKTASLSGIRRIRRIGENDEFEHIRAYAQGDNIKAINWKATSRKNQLMLNQFQDTRSQMVYCVVDKGRSMKMPFNQLTLLDYAINSALALSNIILKNYDKAGLISFSSSFDTFLKADSRHNQIEKIANHLFNETTDFNESNIELLYYSIRKYVTRRSIVIFFTNFETVYDMKRNLGYLKAINRKHLLVVVSFINSEIEEASSTECQTTSDIYYNTIANKSLMEKQQVMQKLRLNNIQTILTRPEDLSLNTINKYLEIKAKRLR